MILFITNRGDITTDFVVKRIQESGTNYYRLNTEDLFNNIDICFDFENNKFELIDKKKGIIKFDEIKSVYFRRPELPCIPHKLDDGEKKFVLREYDSLLNGIYSTLSNKLWINYVYSIREAENKIYQLILAKNIGFSIPNTIITNHSNHAYNFIKANKFNCIIKPIRSGFVDDPINPRVIFTNKINVVNEKELERIKKCPSIFQNNIKKKADVRVTVIGKRIFSVRIESQTDKDSQIDWRKSSKIIDHEQIELPQKIHHQCINLVKRLNLIFGAIDFILDKEGKFHFLEINPNGQWAWIEKRLNLPISNEIAKLLISGENDVFI